MCRLKSNQDSKDEKRRIEEVLEMVSLTKERHTLSLRLSGGMKRRLSIALGIVGHHSQLLILDEPTTGLDPLVRAQVWSLINQLKKSHCILMTTQHLEEAEELADGLALMETGKVVAVGSVDEIKKKFGVGYNLTIKPFNLIEQPLEGHFLANIKDQIISMIPGSYLQ